MKKVYCFLVVATTILSNLAYAQVSVNATAGTPGPTTYGTLKAAFDAINAGTHQGAIIVSIDANTTEGTTPATLNSSDATPAAYTSVLIRPSVDGLSVTGNPATGFGVIQLKGSDNVTIDGDNPNSAGTNRNLTINNTNTATAIANSVIRIATAATNVTSADNNIIKNCNLNGNVTNGNLTGVTSATGSSNSSFGIYCGGNGGATTTDAPTAITSVTTQTAPSGTTINNLTIDNNAITQCARAIVFNGAAATVAPGTTTISNNLIGEQATSNVGVTPPYTTPASTVYTKGIWVGGTTTLIINSNTLKNIMSYVSTTLTAVELVSPNLTSTISNNTIETIANNGTANIVKAILVTNSSTLYTINANIITNVQGLAAASGTDAIEATSASTNSLIQNNKITTVYNRSASTFGAYGLNLTAGTGVQIINNFISDINMNMTGGGAFSTQFSVHAIRITGGTGHKVYHNSVNLFGTLLGTATTAILTSAFTITVATITGVDVRNNIFSNTLTGGTTGIAHVSIYLPSGATVSMNLTINNNAYYSGSTAGSQGIAHGGTTYTSPVTTAGVGLYEAANFNAAATTPVTNLRNYTSTLSAAGTNDNASLAITTAAPFISGSNLHINTGASGSAALDNTGSNASVATDIDAQARNASTPDIGADEFTIAVVAAGIEYFRGSKLGTANYLDWKVNCSSDPSVRLILERSADSRTFTAIQDQNVTAARCAQGFSYTDAAPLAGINYYRLKTISPDGAFRYSVIVALINKDKGFELISVAPNPVKTNTVLSISSVKAGKMSIAVSDMTGKVIMTQNINVIAGNNPVTMNFATLGSGRYNIKVINADNEVKSTSFVKY